jgi:8-oxo-dGTP pyrophosphatase MutT (NUDIX family)
MAIGKNEEISKTIREISAGFIIYRPTRDGIRYLLLYHGGNYWNFPKGKIEAGEKSFRAALRELKEETGLNRNDLIFREYFRTTDKYVFFRGRERIFKIVIFYLAESRRSEIKLSYEHEGYGWFLRRDAMRIIKFRNLRTILKRADDLLAGKK